MRKRIFLLCVFCSCAFAWMFVSLLNTYVDEWRQTYAMIARPAWNHTACVIARSTWNRATPLGTTRNVALAVQCRGPQAVCQQRWPVIESYRPFFRRIWYLVGFVPPSIGPPALAENTLFCNGRSDLLGCIAKVMAIERDAAGVFYMHFDVAISPCNLLHNMAVDTPAVFGQIKNRTVAYQTRCNTGEHGKFPQSRCMWHSWDTDGTHRIRDDYLAAVREINNTLSQHDVASFHRDLHSGMDDLFYVPRALFEEFIALARIWVKHSKVVHEISGPMTMMLLAASHASMGRKQVGQMPLKPVTPVSFNCSGGCCVNLPPQFLAASTFRCGHRVNYQQPGVLQAVCNIQRCVP